MSESLRDALEKMAAKYEGVYTVAGIQPANVPWAEGVDSAYHIAADELRELLAAHPAPVRQPSDAAVEAAEQAMRGHDCHEVVNRNVPHLARAALVAAYRVDAPRPEAIIEKVADVLGVQLYGEEAWNAEPVGDKDPLHAEAYRLAKALRDAGLFEVPVDVPRPLSSLDKAPNNSAQMIQQNAPKTEHVDRFVTEYGKAAGS